jgi:hypothetical protein
VLDLQDDESLRRWKEQLLGSVDLNSVGGKPKNTTSVSNLRSVLPFNWLSSLRSWLMAGTGSNKYDNRQALASVSHVSTAVLSTYNPVNRP